MRAFMANHKCIVGGAAVTAGILFLTSDSAQVYLLKRNLRVAKVKHPSKLPKHGKVQMSRD
jgi:hypothetical protein